MFFDTKRDVPALIELALEYLFIEDTNCSLEFFPGGFSASHSSWCSVSGDQNAAPASGDGPDEEAWRQYASDSGATSFSPLSPTPM